MRRAGWAMLFAVIACGRTNDSAPAVLTSADSSEVMERGGAIATVVAQGLSGRLQSQLSATEAAGAVDFCAESALILTDSLMSPYPGVTVKRTSSRIRNPRNAPDALESAALAWFDSMRSVTGQLPAALVQIADSPEVRYYRPLMVAPFCTQCHGPSETIDESVRAILSRRYPHDQAIGYQAGDMRGVIRVSLPRD